MTANVPISNPTPCPTCGTSRRWITYRGYFFINCASCGRSWPTTFCRTHRGTAALHARLREIMAGPVLSEEEALLCGTVHTVPSAEALLRVGKLTSLAGVFIAHALESALNKREPVLAALAERRLQIEEAIIASANHEPQHMPPMVGSGIGGAT